MAEFKFVLFVAGDGPLAAGAETTMRRLLETHYPDVHELEVVDILTSPERAEAHSIIATPTLLRVDPPPPVRLIGDMSNTARVVAILGLPVG